MHMLVLGWDESNRAAYNNKGSDLQTLCMLMSIGNDFTLLRAQLNPGDIEIEDLLGAMQDDLSMCLTVCLRRPGSELSVTRASGVGGLLTTDPPKQIQAFVVQAFNEHLGTPQTEFTDHLIERRHAALIPNVG